VTCTEFDSEVYEEIMQDYESDYLGLTTARQFIEDYIGSET
jgi:hypothetical protein